MLDIEPLIIDRLASSVPDLAGVHGAASLDADAAAGKKLPAAFVVPDGHRVLETAAQGKRARIATRWLIVIAVRSARNVRGGEYARQDAARIIRDCLVSLMGWTPRDDLQPLIPTSTPSSQYANGLLLYPLAFECVEVILGGN